MSKIDEFEQKIMTHGMTAEDFVEYEKLLKRVRDNFLKRQHCYTTAIQFPPEYAEQAVRLIQYGVHMVSASVRCSLVNAGVPMPNPSVVSICR